MSLDVEYVFCKRFIYKLILVKTYNSIRDFVHDSNAESVNGESAVREKQHIHRGARQFDAWPISRGTEEGIHIEKWPEHFDNQK